MGKKALSKNEVLKIKKLRETGHSLNEIKNTINRGYGTVYRYIKDVPILPEYKEVWRIKRGGSKYRSLKEWEFSKNEASKIINNFVFKDKMIILSCLYWGEGNKKELSLINGDPYLVKVFLECLKSLGISTREIKISLRIFEDINKKEATDFWLKFLGLAEGSISYFEIIKGKKIGKLKYGMCRIRVKNSRKYFKFIMSMVDLIRSNF